MTANEIYTGAGASATLIPETTIKISELAGTSVGGQLLLTTADSDTSLTFTATDTKRLVPNIYRGCMAKIDRFHATTGADESHSQTLMIESNTDSKITFSQALHSSGTYKYKCTILPFGAPVMSNSIISGKPSLLSDNWLGLVNTFTPPSIDTDMKQLNLALGGTRNFGYQYKGAETVGEASLDLSLSNGSWLYYALGSMTFSHTSGNSNTLASGKTNGKAYALASGATDAYRVEGSEIYPPFHAANQTADKVTSITVTNDGAGIPFAASQALTISGGGGSGAAASFTLTRAKNEITVNAATTTNYNNRSITIKAAASTTLVYTFWFDIDNDGGASQPTVSGTTTYVEVTTISSGDAAGTVASELATVINAQTGLTASATGSKITVESTDGGYLATPVAIVNGSTAVTTNELVVGGEIESVTVTNKGTSYSSAPTVGNVTTGSINATFTAVLGADAKADYKEITGDVSYTFTENDTGELPSFALEVTNEKGNVTDANYFQDANTQNLMTYVYTGCQVNTLTLTFAEGQEVTTSVGAVSRKAHRAETNYVPKRRVRTTSNLFNFSNTDSDNNPYMYSDGTIKIFGQTLARIKSGSVTINNGITAQRFIGNYDRTMASAHVAGQRTYEIQLTMLITDRTIWDELRNQNETTSSVGLIEIEFAKSNTDKIIMKFDNYLTTAVDVPFPDDKGALEVSLTAQARTLNSCTYTGDWILQG